MVPQRRGCKSHPCLAAPLNLFFSFLFLTTLSGAFHFSTSPSSGAKTAHQEHDARHMHGLSESSGALETSHNCEPMVKSPNNVSGTEHVVTIPTVAGGEGDSHTPESSQILRHSKPGRRVLVTSGDGDVLLAIKQVLDPHNVLSDWDDSHGDFCRWRGITCSPAAEAGASTRRVVRLNITDMPLKGSIPSFICNLTRLGNVSLIHTNLSGRVPPELSQCKELDYLHLQRNLLTGPIPPELGQLQNLRDLYIQYNNLTGSIPQELGNCTRLTAFDMTSNRLTGHIPASLGNCSELTWFKMTNNMLNGTLPEELGKLAKLEGLYLANNSLEGQIPHSYGRMVALSFLLLTDNHLNGSIPDAFTNLTRLEYVDLTANALTGSIPPSLGYCKALKLLHLTNNSLSGEIPSSLSKCTRLKYLDLAYNKLSGTIPGELGMLQPNLSVLTFRDNLLKGTVPFSVLNANQLLFVDFSNNHLGGELPAVPAVQAAKSGVEFLPKLRVLSLSNNSFTGMLPAWMWALSNMQVLDLSFNNFTGTISSNLSDLAVFRGSITLNSALNDVLNPHNGFFVVVKNGSAMYDVLNLDITVINLSHNKLGGGLPPDLGSLVTLFDLNLAHNNLTGGIPSSLSQLAELQSLDLSFNSLSGPIPDELRKLRLQHLQLSNNNLSGEIPHPGLFQSFAAPSFDGNRFLCGRPLPECRPPPEAEGTALLSDIVTSPGFAVGVVVGFVSVATLIFLWQPARTLVVPRKQLSHNGDRAFSSSLTQQVRKMKESERPIVY